MRFLRPVAGIGRQAFSRSLKLHSFSLKAPRRMHRAGVAPSCYSLSRNSGVFPELAQSCFVVMANFAEVRHQSLHNALSFRVVSGSLAELGSG